MPAPPVDDAVHDLADGGHRSVEGVPDVIALLADVDDPSRERAAAMAKGFVAEAAVFISGEDIQIHGGVGFTWDCDAHLYYKRAKMNDAMLGYQGWQRRRLADLVLDSA